MTSSSIALVTSRANPRATESSGILKRSFVQSGYRMEDVPWDGETDWSRFDALLLLECWNYHLNRDGFLSWLSSLPNDMTVWNPVPIIRWNTDKTYLFRLAEKGIAILPSEFLEPVSPHTAESVMVKNGWNEAIVKPAVGASSYGTRRVTAGTVKGADAELDRTKGWIVQRYFPGISEGEYSFVFFNRKFSHAVLKIPKKNEYRTHVDYGGREVRVTPDAGLIRQASEMLDAVPGPLLYTRVDAVDDRGTLILMELELTEPYMFFDSAPDAAGRFVDAFCVLSART